MAETKKPQTDIPGTSMNEGAPVGRQTHEAPQKGKGRGGSNGTGASTAGRPGGTGGR